MWLGKRKMGNGLQNVTFAYEKFPNRKKDAGNNLSDHINMVHKKGVKGINKHKSPVSPDQNPQKVPSQIKEH
jgi:hypothetical protein